MITPYLSVIVVGRNDDYGVNFLGRLNTFIRSLDYQTKEFSNLIELIIVEWNPLSDRPPLRDVIYQATNFPTRIITVSSEIHQSIGHPSPVLEYYGKNVGIRRSRGEFCLATNPDIIFSQELINELSRRWLRKECFYRTDRYDFHSNGIDEIDASNIVDWACKRTFQAHLIVDNMSWTPQFSNGAFNLDCLPRSQVKTQGIHTNAAGDFIMAHKEAFWSAKGLWESTDRKYHLDAYSVIRLAYIGLRQEIFTSPKCIFHQHHERGTVDPWDPALAFQLGQSRGNHNWGLAEVDLTECTNN